MYRHADERLSWQKFSDKLSNFLITLAFVLQKIENNIYVSNLSI